MRYADMITVNSKFTQQTVRTTFPSLQHVDLPILYPALEIPPATEQQEVTSSSSSKQSTTKRTNLIVSLNRFERKKNLGLLIEAMAWIVQQQQQSSSLENTNRFRYDDVQVVIAGGYDPKNIENIEYRIELQQLAERLQVQHMIDFRHSISDLERNELLHSATMVVYTPSHEHFGIVPLEAMYAYTPVIACHNGGPVETIQHEKTGLLCTPTPESFGKAIFELLIHPDRAIQMGHDGHDHVVQHFSPQHLAYQWETLVQQTLQKGHERRSLRRPQLQQSMIYRVITPITVLYMIESMVVLVLVMSITFLLQYLSILNNGQSILSGIRGLLLPKNDEL
jgi:alpha-1,3/alpha-1,6-mannosyltransferase